MFSQLRKSLSFFLSFLFLVGCAVNLSTGSEQVTPDSTSHLVETDRVDEGMTTSSSLATPQSGWTVRIQNVSSGQYVYEDSGKAEMGDLAENDLRFQWSVQDFQGSKRIQNLASGNYLSIENLQPYVEVIPIQSDWMSCRWTLESGLQSDMYLIRNSWHNWQFLVEQDSNLHYDRVDSKNESANWRLISLDGNLIPTSTLTSVSTLPTPSEPSNTRGAIVPWDEYEAEFGKTNGEIIQPDRTFGTFASESSGRSAVQLKGSGSFVEFTSKSQANSIVVRYIIPDSEDGTGNQATISLYVNDEFRTKLILTSRYSWSYGGEEYTLNTPAAGGAHHFYDETRALVGDISSGSTVKLQIDSDDVADYYVIDLIDLENAAEPGLKPEGFLSIVDFGAIPDDGLEDGDAIRHCIQKAKATNSGVWIPEGVFESEIAPFEVNDVTIQGAGMWYSTIHGKYARFNCVGNNCRFSDFAILGETITRDDESPENGFNGSAGSGSSLSNIWVEHTKVGYWVGPGTTDGLIIINSRFRNLFADGVNFCNGTSNSVVENSHFRNTGDDALASWSPKDNPVNTNNVFRFNTIQIPWRANCLAIYGGQDNKIENNLCADVVTYPGILIAQQFNSNPFSGKTVISNNTLLRAGGAMFNNKHGALKIWAEQGPISGIRINDLLIQDSTFSGIEIEGSNEVTDVDISGVKVINSGTDGLFLHSDLSGQISLKNVEIEGSGNLAFLNNSPKNKFQIVIGEGNIGW